MTGWILKWCEPSASSWCGRTRTHSQGAMARPFLSTSPRPGNVNHDEPPPSSSSSLPFSSSHVFQARGASSSAMASYPWMSSCQQQCGCLADDPFSATLFLRRLWKNFGLDCWVSSCCGEYLFLCMLCEQKCFSCVRRNAFLVWVSFLQLESSRSGYGDRGSEFSFGFILGKCSQRFHLLWVF